MNEEQRAGGREPKRTRLAVGCEGCRIRHLKCDENPSSCRNCEEIGAECVRGVNVRFKDGLSLFKAIEGSSSDIDPLKQAHGLVQFQDETAAVARKYAGTSQQPFPAASSTSTVVQPNITPQAHSLRRYESIHSGQDPQVHHWSLGAQAPLSGSPSDRFSLHQSPQASIHSASAENATHESSDTSPESLNDLFSTNRPHGPFPDARQAVLMRNFVENMAIWADVTDPNRHFETEVPRRAFSQPILRSAMFAFSARHLNRGLEDSATEALEYHNQCLQLLIATLSEPQENVTEDTLAAVAILRQFEEMDDFDNRFHLTGATRILNSTSKFGSSGGLGEAAAWLCLRQDIYISLTSQLPLQTNLDNFLGSSSFVRTDDFAWANRIVFLLASVLRHAFSDAVSAESSGALRQIGDRTEEWYATKPVTFSPIRFTPRGKERERRFPDVWMLSPVHVVGLQYYHLAKIVLAVVSRKAPTLAYDSLKYGRTIEKLVRNHLLVVLGLAKSNPKAENSLYTARHSLLAWGGVLRHHLDQAVAEELLRNMEERTGWNMDGLIHSLKGQWDENSGSD